MSSPFFYGTVYKSLLQHEISIPYRSLLFSAVYTTVTSRYDNDRFGNKLHLFLL